MIILRKKRTQLIQRINKFRNATGSARFNALRDLLFDGTAIVNFHLLDDFLNMIDPDWYLTYEGKEILYLCSILIRCHEAAAELPILLPRIEQLLKEMAARLRLEAKECDPAVRDGVNHLLLRIAEQVFHQELKEPEQDRLDNLSF